MRFLMRWPKITRFLAPFSFFVLIACSSSPQPEAWNSPSEYRDAVSGWSFEERSSALKSVENFFESLRTKQLRGRSERLVSENPVLSSLEFAKGDSWFHVFFETLVAAELMAKSNSFRSYQNQNCLDAFSWPLSNTPLPKQTELMTLRDFLRLGPKIPDQSVYVQQVRIYCGRLAINLFQGLMLAEQSSPQHVSKVYLSLKNNLVLQKLILTRAKIEADLILEAYREALN
jgi:hypothetical protein